MLFDRQVFFDGVRSSLFAGKFSQQQVDGMEAILTEWEEAPYLKQGSIEPDFRHLAYPLATTYHETSQEMWPIEEYGKGSGMEYGKKDPETGQTYYGRGYVQLTWRDNYAKADQKLQLSGSKSCEWYADNALDPNIAADVMFRGMEEGWFRSDNAGKQTLSRYFDADTDDAYGAREIINGDKSKVPSWSNGVSIGNLIKGYHGKFLTALTNAANAYLPEPVPPEPTPEPTPEPAPGPVQDRVVVLALTIPEGVVVEVVVNGEPYVG